ncbi:BirA family transcriptional regulator, biotin operon repressor / biotin---[acetyl-CoA-carboxylase] ligase [Burkholderiaceae bacterium]|nr:BirA family transcriptional regulator, biotin operon repressor / biotin---[acetyl-CoA-carboxylase] ligase [Burkholderiaceae bacterium]
MPDHPLRWGAEALWEQLTPQLPGLSVEVVARIASTNSALLERARIVAPPSDDGEFAQVRRSVESSAFGRRAADLQPCLLVAEHQTHGRGRQGRVWQAAPGASLTFSLALPLAPRDWAGLSLAVGVALAEALDPLQPQARPLVGVKWPNDLWLLDGEGGGRKMGGILIETVAAANRRLAVIGIGINVQPMSPSEAASGYACVQEIDPQATAPQVLQRIARPLVDALRRFELEGFPAFAAAYARRDMLRDRAVRTTHPDVPEGVAVGLSDNGGLLVKTPEGIKEVTSGEVSVRLHPAGDAAS